MLNLNLNNVKELPMSISNLISLKSLWLSHNSLNSIPNSIKHLQSLKFLDFSSNNLKNLPDFIGNLKNLEELQLQGNRLEYLPESLNKLESLKFLNLNSNPLKKKGINALQIIDQLREKGITVFFFEEKFYESPKFTELTKDVILLILSNEWENYYTLIRKLGIKTMKDARDLQSKLKELHRNGFVLKEIKNGRTHWKKNKRPSSDFI